MNDRWMNDRWRIALWTMAGYTAGNLPADGPVWATAKLAFALLLAGMFFRLACRRERAR